MEPKKKKRKTTNRGGKTSTRGWKQLDILKAFANALKKAHNMFDSFPDDFLKEEIFSFLSANDLTTLSLTSRTMLQKVSLSRKYPCVVWEERLPTKMKYRERDDEGFTTLFQKHPFRFMVRTAAYGKTFRVDFSLFNEAWDEASNMRDGLDCRTLDQFPSRTFPYVRIRKLQDNGVWEDFFEADCYFFYGVMDEWRVSLGSNQVFGWGMLNHSTQGWQGLKAAQRGDLRFSMNSALLCAKHIATFPDRTAYPSAEYLMWQFPDWLREYFPSDFDRREGHTDRRTKIEFSYRPARTLQEWSSYVPSDVQAEYELDEIPWYSRGYQWFSDDESDDEGGN